MPKAKKKKNPVPPLSEDVDFAGRQSVGVRFAQEDRYKMVPLGDPGDGARDLLVVVGDGLGGHVAGEVASSLAVGGFVRAFAESEEIDDAQRMRKALDEANRLIAEAVGAGEGLLDGMGTTLLAVLVRGRTARWISVGDSPLFLVRGGEARRLNRLHNLAAQEEERRAEGMDCDGEEDQTEPTPGAASVLLSALTGGEISMVDESGEVLPLEPGDVLAACTDGIDTLSPAELAAVLGNPELQDSAARMVEALLDAVAKRNHPRQDNTTVVLACIPSGKPSSTRDSGVAGPSAATGGS